jgi:LysM repeat protein
MNMVRLLSRSIIFISFNLLMNQFMFAQSDLEINLTDSIPVPTKKSITIPEFKLIDIDTIHLDENDELICDSYCALGMPSVYDALHSFNYRRVDKFGGYLNVKVNEGLENIREKGFKSDIKQFYIQIDPKTLTVYWIAVVGPSTDGRCYVRVDSRGSAGGGLAAVEKQLPQMHSLYQKLTSVKLLEFKEDVIKCYSWNSDPVNNICSYINIRQHFYKYYDSQVDSPISLEEYSNKNPISVEKEIIPVVKKPKIRQKKYKVKVGDSLSEIAEKNHTSVSKLKKANGLRSDTIQIGQVLKIP